MSYSNNYNITTLSSSIYQRILKGGAVVAPFVLGAPKRGDPLRETCQPGAVLGGVIPTGSSFPMPWDREGCLPPPQTTILPLVASTATTYLPDVEEGGVTGSYPLIASTSVIYTPTIIPGGVTASLNLISSFANTKSVAFNGVSGESQLTVPDSDSLSFGADGTIGNEPSFSWSAWIKPTTLGMSPFGIVSKIATGGAGDEYFFGYIPLVGLVLLIADGAGFTDDYIAQTNVTLTADEWQHVCCTYDGSRVPGGIKLYLNGVEKASVGLTPGSYTAMSNSSADLVIGRRWSGLTTNVSDGFIDEVAAFDKELSSAEVSELYNSAQAINLNTFSAVSDLVSWWRMGDEALGASPDYTIPDQIGSNNGAMSSFQGDSTSGVVVDAVSAPSQTFAPTLISDVNFYTQIVSASNPNNSSSLQVGSLYLDAQTYTTIGALFTDIKGGVGGSDAHVEFKRFTTGASLVTLNNTSTAGPTWRYITGSNVIVSNADWYDIYISASGNPATSSIRGVYYEI